MKATHRIQYIYRPHRRHGASPRTGTLKPALRITGATLAAIGLTIGAAANVRIENGQIIISAIQ